jgi:hypothetical protein
VNQRYRISGHLAEQFAAVKDLLIVAGDTEMPRIAGQYLDSDVLDPAGVAVRRCCPHVPGYDFGRARAERCSRAPRPVHG